MCIFCVDFQTFLLIVKCSKSPAAKSAAVRNEEVVVAAVYHAGVASMQLQPQKSHVINNYFQILIFPDSSGAAFHDLKSV